jgi:pimeloyl-ACP methyl ester carboxylesterase
VHPQDPAHPIQPFSLSTPAGELDALRDRIRGARLPEPLLDDAGWEIGTDPAYLRELVGYWADGFDWPAQEAALNELPHHRATVEGIGIHFIHVRAATGDGFPLVLSHGWPDSFWRYLKVAPLLADPAAHGGDPADAFDVVIPSLPGFGYSDKPRAPGMHARRIAGLWAGLMTGVLGYSRFGAAGGDLGSAVSRFLGLDHAEHVVGVHRTDAGMPLLRVDPAELAEEERAYLAEVERWRAAEGAYALLQRTKPQTLAAALNDSPVGLAAWIVEKLRAWSDCDGVVERRFTKDELLTNITIYWLTQTIGSSFRLYHDAAAIPMDQHARRIEVPCALALFPHDIARPPRRWVERTANIVHWTELPRGGHFAPFEEPELYADDLRAFFRPLRAA